MEFNFSIELALSMQGLNHQAIDQKWQSYYGQTFNLKQFHQLSNDFWYFNINTYSITIQSGLTNLLSCLHKYHIDYAVATNSPKKIANYCLERAQLNSEFPLVISADQVSYAKPAADIFHYTAAQLGCSITQCWVLEDSLTGIQAAYTAGAIPIWISAISLSHQDLVPPDSFIHCQNLNQIAQMIDQLHSQIKQLQL
jgi:HAD superfamily hydrolase (TIGR01509 family)